MMLNRGRRKLRITPRQQQVLRLVAQGKRDKEVAAQLHISIATVRTHLERLYQTNNLHNRAEAVALLLQLPGARITKTSI
jgi:two-component system nitrate/nitrite response regulator NarL